MIPGFLPEGQVFFMVIKTFLLFDGFINKST